jgi:hypothetical protein
VNVPSADITPKGGHFVMHETQWRPWSTPGGGSYWLGTNFYAYGVGKNTELTVTNYNSGTPAAKNFTTGIGFKTALPLFANSKPKSEVKFTFGQKLLINHRGGGLGSFSYGHLSMRLPKVKTRVSGGAFHSTEQLMKRNTVDFLGGIEHPLWGKRLQLIGEWFRGRHDFGFAAAGFLYHPKPNQFIVVAYKVPNFRSNGGDGFVLEYGITFGGSDEGH